MYCRRQTNFYPSAIPPVTGGNQVTVTINNPLPFNTYNSIYSKDTILVYMLNVVLYKTNRRFSEYGIH